MTFRTDAIAQDWPRLAEHLEAHGLHLALDAPARQFASGFANFNYLLEVDGTPCVLRRPPRAHCLRAHTTWSASTGCSRSFGGSIRWGRVHSTCARTPPSWALPSS